MRSIIVIGILSSRLVAQTYDNPQSNRGPDHGSAENFSVTEWKGVVRVGSELTVDGRTYCYIRTSEEDFKLSRKAGERFTDVIPKLMTTLSSSRGMDEYSRLLHIYEDEKIVNIYSSGSGGYHFLFYQKRSNQPPRLIRFGCIQNLVHSMEGFDDSIKALEFTGAAQLKISKDPATEAQKKLSPYLFKRPGVYEFRSDGVYLDGVFDPSVPDYEPQDIVVENRLKDPQYYQKKHDLHAERVASYRKELRDAEAARIAALPPKPTPSPIIKPTLPVAPVAPITTVPTLPKPVVVAAAKPVVTQNFSSWLVGLAALVAVLLGYLGWRYFGKKAKP